MPEQQEEDEVSSLIEKLEKSTVQTNKRNNKRLLLCDASYGLPRESRPRKERILAIARQLVNFLEWQTASSHEHFAEVVVVGCSDGKEELLSRIQSLWKGELPSNLSFSPASLICQDAVYLSPDASEILSTTEDPPDCVVVGLLIDRRIKKNRSLDHANEIGMKAARLDLTAFDFSKSEPLNVDTVMCAMQQWWWNANENHQDGDATASSYFKAVDFALKQHCSRHPGRQRHKPIGENAT